MYVYCVCLLCIYKCTHVYFQNILFKYFHVYIHTIYIIYTYLIYIYIYIYIYAYHICSTCMLIYAYIINIHSTHTNNM